jgi:membrane protease YdiL (CAAX protease family)
MPTVLDHVLVGLITILLPLHDLLFWFPRVVRAGPAGAGRARIHAYRESIIVEWTLVAVTALVWSHYQRLWPDLGFAAPGGWKLYQRHKLAGDDDPEVREAVLEQIGPLRPLLPHTERELTYFSAISITAGICEEVLYRGFLIWYLSLLVPLVPAVLIGSLLFGFAHAYQGTRGVLQTGAVGLALAVLYVFSGSLWIPMLLHAFVDLNSGLLAHEFLRREREDMIAAAAPPADPDRTDI